MPKKGANQAQKGFPQGLWLRLRYGDRDREGAGQDERELRMILNYTLRALR